MSNKKVSVESDPKFSKIQLVNSVRFQNQKDLVNALLTDDGEYAISEVEDMIQKYMKGKVN